MALLGLLWVLGEFIAFCTFPGTVARARRGALTGYFSPLHANTCSATILNCKKHLYRKYRHICVGVLDVETSSQRATAGARYIIYIYCSSGDGFVVNQLFVE